MIVTIRLLDASGSAIGVFSHNVLPGGELRQFDSRGITIWGYQVVVEHTPDDLTALPSALEVEPLNIEQGVKITVGRTAARLHTLMVREGCDGSPNCALEIYGARGTDYLGNGSGRDDINCHFSDDEAETLFQAVKAVRKARRKELRKRSR